MTNLSEQRQRANNLRKNGNHKEALEIYKRLWKESGDKYDGTGLLQCLRKLSLFDEAIPLADDLIKKYKDFEWCKNEVIWTYIQGIFNKFDKNNQIDKILEVANKIMLLNPDGLARKKVVFTVLGAAKSHNNWKIINEWVNKLNPETLSSQAMKDDKGRERWSEQAVWYNYYIKGLLEKADFKEILNKIDDIIAKFPKQKKFFIRFKAQALYFSGNLAEAENLYKSLCKYYKSDWWLFHEYAKVVLSKGKKEEALHIMYKAASLNTKYESMVSLLNDIGLLCKELKFYETALAHFNLCKLIREERKWSIPESLNYNIMELNSIIDNKEAVLTFKEELAKCKKEWYKVINNANSSDKELTNKREERKNLKGKVKLINDKPYCFIFTNKKDSFFCYRTDLPENIVDGDEVYFDAVPSFDKKKNKESWKAVNIRK